MSAELLEQIKALVVGLAKPLAGSLDGLNAISVTGSGEE